MQKLDRQALESLLQARSLDRTVIPFGSRPARVDALEEVAPTGIAILDRRLEGGLPRGQLSEIVGERSTGRSGLLAAVLREATHREELVALVDPCDIFDPTSGMAAGLDLSRLLWVRGDGHDRVLARALKAVSLLLQSGDFGIVVLDLAELSPRALQQTPFTTWRRLQRYLEGGRTACVLIGAKPMARGPRGVTLELRSKQPIGRWTGRGAHQVLDGLTASVRIIRACAPEDEAVEFTLEPPGM
jgi:hypothetical protein